MPDIDFHDSEIRIDIRLKNRSLDEYQTFIRKLSEFMKENCKTNYEIAFEITDKRGENYNEIPRHAVDPF